MTPTANARGATSRGAMVTKPKEVAHGALRGAIAAMAMTGMRAFTVDAGIVEEPPPRAILRQRAEGLLKQLPRNRRRGAVELFHWAYGAGGGAAFAILPDAIRMHRWAGPAYGLAIWAGFEAGIAPALGLSQAKRTRPLDRIGLALDHLLYGFVLGEMRSRPRS
jgi:hypothetical protein